MTTHPTTVPTIGHLGDKYRATVGQYVIGRQVAKAGAIVTTSAELSTAWVRLFCAKNSI